MNYKDFDEFFSKLILLGFTEDNIIKGYYYYLNRESSIFVLIEIVSRYHDDKVIFVNKGDGIIWKYNLNSIDAAINKVLELMYE